MSPRILARAKVEVVTNELNAASTFGWFSSVEAIRSKPPIM
jgi:hypothetical protein